MIALKRKMSGVLAINYCLSYMKTLSFIFVIILQYKILLKKM